MIKYTNTESLPQSQCISEFAFLRELAGLSGKRD
jgi:hypothetical protein